MLILRYIIECISYKVILIIYFNTLNYMFNNCRMRERIKESMDTELPEIKKLYEESRKLQNTQQRKDNENQNKINS